MFDVRLMMSEMKGRLAMRREEMEDRTKVFALRIIRLATKLPKSDVARVIARQLLRSGTSVGANYREASRSSTKRHFTSTLTIALRRLMKLCTGWNFLWNPKR
jgi:hypothetical protein